MGGEIRTKMEFDSHPPPPPPPSPLTIRHGRIMEKSVNCTWNRTARVKSTNLYATIIAF